MEHPRISSLLFIEGLTVHEEALTSDMMTYVAFQTQGEDLVASQLKKARTGFGFRPARA